MNRTLSHAAEFARVITISGAAIALGACAQGTLNTSPAVGFGKETWTPPTIASKPVPVQSEGEFTATTDQKAAPVYTAGGVLPAADAARSVNDLDRSGWNQTTVLVPNDAPEHRPLYTRSILTTQEQYRQQGRFPTAQSALDTPTTATENSQIGEAFITPFAAAADVVLFIPRAVFVARPYQPTRTGSWPYARRPEQNTIVPPVTVPVPQSAPKGPQQPESGPGAGQPTGGSTAPAKPEGKP